MAVSEPQSIDEPFGQSTIGQDDHYIIGSLSGRVITLPKIDTPPIPSLAPPGIILNGYPVLDFDAIDSTYGYPDVRSFKRKFGLIMPATNTTMEHELWSIIGANRGPNGLDGIGLHTTNVVTLRPQLASRNDLEEYKAQFLDGLRAVGDQVLLAEPHYLIFGMSLEHILCGLNEVRKPADEIARYSGRSCATWHDAAPAALNMFGAKRIGLLTPFNQLGNENAIRLFEDLGFEVVASVGFSCANALHIAHVPDSAKKRAIMELLATPGNALDAVVQCGTNMSLLDVCEALEPTLGIPILGINAVLFWYALRENGFSNRIIGAGRLFREF